MAKVTQRAPAVHLGPTEVAKCPDLAVKIATIVSSWSYVEDLLGSILGNLMRADPRTTIILLDRFVNTNQKCQAVRKIAKERLDNPEFEDFKSDLSVFENVAKERHKIAHGLWGNSDQRPDELVYITPGRKDEWERLFLGQLQSPGFKGPEDIDWPEWEFYDRPRFAKIEEEILTLIKKFSIWKAKTALNNAAGNS